MRGHAAHMWLCAAMIAGALIVVLITGNGFALMPVVGCVLMMVVMMQMMGGHGHGRGGDRK
jgi:hypothetical protein